MATNAIRTSIKSRVAVRPRDTRVRIERAATIIFNAHEQNVQDFDRLTVRAQRRFEKCDWAGRVRDAARRYDLYEDSLDKTAAALRRCLGPALRDVRIWWQIKRMFGRLISGRYDCDLAETYYNSVTRKVLLTVGIDREIEFFRLSPTPPTAGTEQDIYNTYVVNRPTHLVVREILRSYGFGVEYRDITRDAELVAQEINLRLWPILHYGATYQIDMIGTPFYRNKVAYLVGRIRAADKILPLILPLYNGPNGIFVDTALMDEADTSIVFSFAFSQFQVRVKRHHHLIEFLRSIMPSKPLSDLYFSLGFTKHGKTEFYRTLHKYVHESKEKFIIAPGKEGAVMIGFTMPSFGYVFKLIKDRPCFLRSQTMTEKRTNREEVLQQYEFVCRRDRVGRMVDTQEFTNLRFKRKRFTPELLAEFEAAAKQCVHFEGMYVVIEHLYLQRRVTPLPMYLLEDTDPEAIRRVVVDFGYFLKDIASVGVFPLDLFNIWNYGVTRRGRVVLFDYDDVTSLEKVNFRDKPAPRDYMEELQPDEDRIAAMPNDFFMDETEHYSGIPIPLMGILKRAHGDLFTVEFWVDLKKRVKRGELFDITPYDRRKKFEYRLVGL